MLAVPQEVLPEVVGPDVPNPLALIGTIIDTAEELTHLGMTLSEEITTGSLHATDSLLSFAGAQSGATVQ